MAFASSSAGSDIGVATATAAALLLMLAGTGSTGRAQAGEALLNWFDDPFFYIDGCAADDAMVAQVEPFARALPHVQQAIAAVRTDPLARPPYKTRVISPEKATSVAQTPR